MDNNMFGNTQGNEYDNDPSTQETQDGQQASVNTADTQTANGDVQIGQTQQYYSGSTPQYSGDAQNPYTYESATGQNPYSYENQNNQNTYSYGDPSSQNNQNVYSYNGTNNQNTYAYNNQNTYGNQDAQNTQNPYSYGYQNNQNAQNQYSYAGQNNSYAASYGQNNNGYQGYQPELEEPVKMGDWLLLQCLLSFIPCVGLILAIVWAFSKTEKQSKVNFCKAYLIVALVQLAFVFIIILIYGGVFLALWDTVY